MNLFGVGELWLERVLRFESKQRLFEKRIVWVQINIAVRGVGHEWFEAAEQEGDMTDGVCPELPADRCPDGIKIGCCSNKFCKPGQVCCENSEVCETQCRTPGGPAPAFNKNKRACTRMIKNISSNEY
ncbi:hypothetical protein TNCV_1812301 [Trichonephila clavipes]|uniref:Uncharacterized protein n=1 Tax=Trichonephila clavipes TaxID=2585209 RepID=A0A8X6W7N9_TRICX|nr:hypothetical protein TNCV_1812301 [Trichonephila clavipes]